jgi:single-stranded DNA-binding protein
MAAKVEITGNLLQNPEQRKVQVRGEDRLITEIRVFADFYKREGGPDGELVQDNEKSQPYRVTIWHERLGENIMKLLRKGNRVRVEGDLTASIFNSNDHGPLIDSTVAVNDSTGVTLVLTRIEEIRFTPKREMADSAT